MLSTESMIGVLFIILLVALYSNFFESIADKAVDSLQQSVLYDLASSTSLLVSTYSYSLKHGSFEPRLNCSITSNVVCKDDANHISMVPTYLRKGGGD